MVKTGALTTDPCSKSSQFLPVTVKNVLNKVCGHIVGYVGVNITAMHHLIAPYILATLLLVVFTGIYIIIRNEIKIRNFSIVIKKRLKAQNLKKLSKLESQLPAEVLKVLPTVSSFVPALKYKKQDRRQLL